MIVINLIPPGQKHLLKIRRLYQLVEFFLNLFVFYSIILAIVLIPLNQIINGQADELKNTQRELELKNSNLTKKIKALNGQIDSLTAINREFFNWSKYFLDIAALVPNEISLNQFSSNRLGQDFIIRGFAQTRDSLIKFKENLSASPLVKEVNVPLSNLLTEQEITFEITGKIN